jgi:flagellar basal body-associated protein FliL
MNKKLLIIVLAVVVLALIGGGYYYWQTKTQKSTAQQATEDVQKTAADISSGIGNNVSPDLTTPAVTLPNTDANPYNKTNPFTNLKTNPFQ